MRDRQLSRRQLVGGLLAGLIGWCWPGKVRGGAPSPAAGPCRLVADRFVTVMTYTFDAEGRILSVQTSQPPAAEPPAWLSESAGRLTTYTYAR